jgi:signal recognition particle subunit SEC65
VIAKFLEVKSGYCVHFASAMALMARALGIPSRVTEGYLPGTSNGGSVNNPGIYTVTSDDLHAWPELYFAGVGWVPFEPTVSRGIVPSYTVPQGTNNTSSANPSASGNAGHASLAPEITNGPNSATGATVNAAQPIASAVGVTLLVVLLLLTPAFLRRLRRRSRFRKLRDEWGLAVLAWDELRDTARDLGWSVPDTETPRAFAERLREAIGDGERSDAVGRLLTAVERESFGPPGRYIAHGVPDDLQDALTGLESYAGRAVRVKALLAPVSLIPPSWSPTAGVRPTNA